MKLSSYMNDSLITEQFCTTVCGGMMGTFSRLNRVIVPSIDSGPIIALDVF